MDKKQPSDSPQAPSHPAATTPRNTAMNTTTATTTTTTTTTSSAPSQANLSSTLLPSPSDRPVSNRSAGSQNHHQQPTSQPAQPTEPSYPHQINGVGGPTATAPFLRDFSLVAEAASRAQVSVVTRDLEGVSL